MTKVTATQQTLTAFSRIAIIDDVYADPNRLAVSENLDEFCASIAAEDEGVINELHRITGCNFVDASQVDDAAIAALYAKRDGMANLRNSIDTLFLEYDQRRSEVEQIEALLRRHGLDVTSFSSIDNLFGSEPFSVVFLDWQLAKDGESEEIAKQIYREFNAFIFLMSNKPGAAKQEEEFRRKSRLLRGFFHFCEKSELCDESQLERRLASLPQDPEICHTVHAFVGAIDNALGGNIDEPAEGGDEDAETAVPLCRFMKTLRTLGLQDYAILCELTLRDEGHPLGDYIIRLLGAHLIAQLMQDSQVRASVEKLDRKRFTEFLPFGSEISDSLKELYASSLVESVSESWGSHPWDV